MNKYARYGIALLLAPFIFLLFIIAIVLSGLIIAPMTIVIMVMIIAGDGDKADQLFDFVFDNCAMSVLMDCLMNIQERWIKIR
jgi:hypothetical protein